MPTTRRDPGDDPLGAARGLLIALLIGAGVWLIIAWLIADVLH
jgi:hypothetical protein